MTKINNGNTRYVIHSMKERGFWHNTDGWTSSIKHATHFNQAERDTLNLPLVDSDWIVVDYGD